MACNVLIKWFSVSVISKAKLLKKTIFHNIRHALIFRVTYFLPPNSKQFPYLLNKRLIFLSLNTKKYLPANRSHFKPRAPEPTFPFAGLWRSALRYSALSLHFIASRRHFECNFFKSPQYVPPGIRWEDPNGVGDGPPRSNVWACAENYAGISGIASFDSKNPASSCELEAKLSFYFNEVHRRW